MLRSHLDYVVNHDDQLVSWGQDLLLCVLFDLLDELID